MKKLILYIVLLVVTVVGSAIHIQTQETNHAQEIADVRHEASQYQIRLLSTIGVKDRQIKQLERTIQNQQIVIENLLAKKVQPLPKAEAIEFLDYCIFAHQYYADRPEECNLMSGTPEWNAECAEIYKWFLALIEEE